jgi:hypothetical protein
LVNHLKKGLNNFSIKIFILLSFKNSKLSLTFLLLSFLLIFNFVDYSFGQINDSNNDVDKAKISSDKALSLIDSLKGSSLLDSVVGDMGNFSTTNLNKSNNTDVKIGLLNDSAKNNSLIVIDRNVTKNDVHNKTLPSLEPDGNLIKSNMENMQSLLILPHPMSIQSKDYIPLYSSMPSKIFNGTILTKLPCDSNNKPKLQIAGSSSDNNVFPINLDLIPNLSRTGSMCMYKSIFPDNLSNSLYSHTLTNIYLYNTLDTPMEVPTTTSIFIGIHKLSM